MYGKTIILFPDHRDARRKSPETLANENDRGAASPGKKTAGGHGAMRA